MKTPPLTLDLIVALLNADGEGDFWFCRLECTEDDIENGDHFTAASHFAEREGYDATPSIVFDRFSPAFSMLHPHFTWETATLFDINEWKNQAP